MAFRSIHYRIRIFLSVCMFLFTGFTASLSGAQSPETPSRQELFSKGATHMGAGISAGNGLTIWGTLEKHDLVFGWIGWGKVLSGIIAENEWYEGNVEFWGEFFAGEQQEPDRDYFVGVTPFIRYNFTRRGNFVPFIDAGAGLSVTEIDEPDLSGGFQFNLRAGIGFHYMVKEHWAVTFHGRIFHFSNAGLDSPNHGVNTFQYSIGLNRFF